MALTKEELMKPRYKQIADWPFMGSKYKIGNIFIFNLEVEAGIVAAYPHLYKPLKWWEERKPEDMPEYITMKRVKGVFKVKRYVTWKYWYVRLYGYPSNVQVKSVLPADESEYQSYTNSK